MRLNNILGEAAKVEVMKNVRQTLEDVRREAEVFDECIRRYATIPVRTVLELRAGATP